MFPEAEFFYYGKGEKMTPTDGQPCEIGCEDSSCDRGVRSLSFS